MDIKINAVHFDADKKLEDFIEKKISKVVEKHSYVNSIEVILKLDKSPDKENKVCEIKMTAKGDEFFSKKQTSSFEESTDDAVDALRKQLEKYKEKHR